MTVIICYWKQKLECCYIMLDNNIVTFMLIYVKEC